MNFDDQLLRYFGTPDLAAIAPGALDAGIEQMRVDLGLSKDRERRFALWTLLHMLGRGTGFGCGVQGSGRSRRRA